MNEELARNLYVAYISQRLGIKMDYAKKKYADVAVGAYWLALAEVVSNDMLDAMGGVLK